MRLSVFSELIIEHGKPAMRGFMFLTAVFVAAVFFIIAAGTAEAERDKNEGDLFAIAQLHYGGGGDWYEDRTSMIRLQQRLEEEFGLRAAPDRRTVRIMDDELFSYPLIFMTGHGNVVFSPEEVLRLKQYFQRGGFLWISDDYGIDEALRREMKKVFPGSEFVELPFDHPVYRKPYMFESGPPKIHEHAGGPPRGYALFLDSRMIVFYDFNTDIGDGLEAPGIHNDPENVREQAFKMAVNIAYFALTQ